MSECTKCLTLEAIVQRQQAEIQRLRQVINQARGACLNIAANANQVMKKGGIPRATYGYHKAQKETAETVSKYLE